jgi:hypothetical protein
MLQLLYNLQVRQGAKSSNQSLTLKVSLMTAMSHEFADILGVME